MMKNLESVAVRGDRLEDIGERAEMLTMNADMFQRSAARVRKGGMAFARSGLLRLSSYHIFKVPSEILWLPV